MEVVSSPSEVLFVFVRVKASQRSVGRRRLGQSSLRSAAAFASREGSEAAGDVGTEGGERPEVT